MNQTVKDKLKELPREPGVYLFKNERGKIIYVGKSKRLKNRVSSYFQKNLGLGTKTQALVSRVADFDIVLTQSELEALILEAELIKQHKPKYNVALKDDKSYLYIVIRNDVITRDGKRIKVPKVLTARKTDLLPKDIAFGPYPSANTAKSILRIIRKVFPYRNCSSSKFNKYQRVGNPCLYGHLGLCQAPCVKENDMAAYKKDIKRIRRFLSGDGSTIVNEYVKRMKTASKEQEFEEAAFYRDVIKRFNYIRANFKTAEKYIENPNLVEDLARESLEELAEHIPSLTQAPERIECYDISNISGKEAVGSMVVSTDGQIDKSEYKRFKIKLKDQPDDFHMMREVLERRLKREVKPAKNVKKWKKPDLLVMDGGKGQVSVIADLMQEMGVDIPLIGLAKRQETIVYKDADGFEEINLPMDNEGLKLLIRLRDEAHRFAQKYHHYLRLKKIRV